MNKLTELYYKAITKVENILEKWWVLILIGLILGVRCIFG